MRFQCPVKFRNVKWPMATLHDNLSMLFDITLERKLHFLLHHSSHPQAVIRNKSTYRTRLNSNLRSWLLNFFFGKHLKYHHSKQHPSVNENMDKTFRWFKYSSDYIVTGNKHCPVFKTTSSFKYVVLAWQVITNICLTRVENFLHQFPNPIF